MTNGTDSQEVKEKVLLVLQQLIKNGDITRSDILSVVPGPKGRVAPELPSFTFKSSGITAKVRTLGPFTLDAVNRQMRDEINPPEIPKRLVNYGTEDQPDFKTEENPADPEYRILYAEYEKNIEDTSARKMIDVIIDNAVVVDIDKDEVEFMRKFLLDLGVKADDVNKETDHAIYVKHVCIKSADDLKELQQFVIGQSMPSEALVQAHEDSFQGDVSQQADRSMQDDAIRDRPQRDTEVGVRMPVVGV